MLTGLKTKAAHTAKRAGLLTGGLLALAVGVAFLTAAAWIYLSAVLDARTAALIIGGVFAGAGFVLIGIASSGAPHEEQSDHRAARRGAAAEASEQPPLMQAFFHGMQAGVSATQSRR
jgi:predicted phage tail protein